MARQQNSLPPLHCHPLTPERWDDFERLFGKSGAYGGCWCMWWRTTRSRFAEQQGEGNRQAMRDIVFSGEVPGVLGYVTEEPAAWCSIAPRTRTCPRVRLHGHTRYLCAGRIRRVRPAVCEQSNYALPTCKQADR